jgi:2'-5' RNA ligase
MALGAEMKPELQEEESQIRTFICIEVPETVKTALGALQAKLRPVPAEVSWVKPANIHITLKFLGGVLASKLDEVIAGTRRAAASGKPFELEVSGAGCFPSPKSPRVLWVGLANVPTDLNALYERIENEMYAQGFEREKRPFSPHLTIGRVRSPANSRQIGELITATGFGPERFRASEIIVMKSSLSPKGSVYTSMAVVPLSG